jgi:hypothetical protein
MTAISVWRQFTTSLTGDRSRAEDRSTNRAPEASVTKLTQEPGPSSKLPHPAAEQNSSSFKNPGRNRSLTVEFIRWPLESPGAPQTAWLLGQRASRRLGPFFGKPLTPPRWLRFPAGNLDSQVRAAHKACWLADRCQNTPGESRGLAARRADCKCRLSP